MDKAGASPLFVSLFFIARCIIPLILMLGVSYLLRKMGLIAEPPKPPPGYEDENNENSQNNHTTEGDLAHGNT
jgi:hypothetical protein